MQVQLKDKILFADLVFQPTYGAYQTNPILNQKLGSVYFFVTDVHNYTDKDFEKINGGLKLLIAEWKINIQKLLDYYFNALPSYNPINHITKMLDYYVEKIK